MEDFRIFRPVPVGSVAAGWCKAKNIKARASCDARTLQGQSADRSVLWRVAKVAGSRIIKVGVDGCCRSLDAGADGLHDHKAQTHDGSGQHDPVNGHSTVFVFGEMFEDVQKFHGWFLGFELMAVNSPAECLAFEAHARPNLVTIPRTLFFVAKLCPTQGILLIAKHFFAFD
jgi:hypothetical protein